MEKDQKCCTKTNTDMKKGLFSGILYGLIPHSFCLAFALFSAIGAITASVFLKKILLIENIFYYLILISIILATASILIYLKKTKHLSRTGIKRKWKYVSIIYTTTIIINLVFFYGAIPILANVGPNINYGKEGLASVSLKVGIPCTGHSFLIIDEVKKTKGIVDVQFVSPNIFNVTYDQKEITDNEIENQEIFKTFKATLQ